SAERDLFEDLPVSDDADAIGVCGRLRVVGDEDDRLAPLHATAPEGVEDLGPGRVVEVAGGLVREEERRPGHERTGDGDAPLLAGRSSPPSSCRSVLLPDPDGPMSATNSPSSTVREMPRSASTVVSPNR